MRKFKCAYLEQTEDGRMTDKGRIIKNK